MAYYAELDENNVVINVIGGATEDLEQALEETTGNRWRRTSYNTSANVHALGGTPFRYNYAGIGFTFDPDYGTDGAFISPQIYPSWKLSKIDGTWKAPKPYPEDGVIYDWNEDLIEWVKRDS